MRNAFLLLMVLSAGVYVSAQQAISANPAKSVGCPIGFGAQVNARAIAQTAEDQKKIGDAPLLELTFGQRDTPKIVSASVTVHGLSSSHRFLPVDQGSDENATESFELGQGHGATGLTHTAVWVRKMLFVNWAEVTELKYADGSTWHASSDSQCRVVPSKLRLIDAVAGQR
jgi:hypothetical protein